jgi:signal transduction histidine kinase
MRRSLIVTVAATVAMVLLAMLVPMAVLVRNYALEDRLARAALEVQATETVVSGQDKGAVAVYLDRVNGRAEGIITTVLYPDGTAIGPTPGEDARVIEARATGQARVDNSGGGAQILVPVSLGGNSTLPELTPVVRVEVDPPGLGSGVLRAWLILGGLGLVLLAGALLLADRLGRSFVRPIRELAADAERLGEHKSSRSPLTAEGPAEVRELRAALNRLVARIEVLLERERQGVSNLSHRLRTPITTLRLRVDAVSDPADRDRLSGDLDELEQMVDHIVREARRSEREGLVPAADAIEALTERAQFWMPLAEDQGRTFQIIVPARRPTLVRASRPDLVALLDVLLDNVFTHTPEGAAVNVTISSDRDGGAHLVVEDAGPGFSHAWAAADRGISGVGSTGLGLAIVTATAEQSGGGAVLGVSQLGGAKVDVTLGPAV